MKNSNMNHLFVDFIIVFCAIVISALGILAIKHFDPIWKDVVKLEKRK